MKEKQKTDIMKIINGYAGGHRHLITAGRILAAVSAFTGLVPFYDLWRIIRIAVKGEELSQIKNIAWQALGITILTLLIYIAALFCTHIAAFHVQASMRSGLICRLYQLYHLVVIIETLYTVITGLIGVILILPTCMRFGHAVQKGLDTNYMKIFAAVSGTVCHDVCDLRLRIFGIVRTH